MTVTLPKLGNLKAASPPLGVGFGRRSSPRAGRVSEPVARPGLCLLHVMPSAYPFFRVYAAL